MPWHEGSLFVPPGKWFHQHFNLSGTPARYVAFHPPLQFHGYAEKVEDRAKDQIEYPDEDPGHPQLLRERAGQAGPHFADAGAGLPGPRLRVQAVGHRLSGPWSPAQPGAAVGTVVDHHR